MTQAAHQLLQDARALILDPAHWTQGAYARDRHGNEIATGQSGAVCFCAHGAVLHTAITGEFRYQASWDAMDALSKTARRVHGLGVEGVNDTIGHRAVLALYDLAMERVRP